MAWDSIQSFTFKNTFLTLCASSLNDDILNPGTQEGTEAQPGNGVSAHLPGAW